MEPHKCESWKWVKWENIEVSARKNPAAQETDGAQAEHVIQRIFLPLANLVQHRPGFVPFETWAKTGDLEE